MDVSNQSFEDEKTAVHEAGHALARFAFGMPITLLSIENDEDGVGWCEGDGEQLIGNTVMALSGAEAERQHFGIGELSDSDRALAVRKSDCLCKEKPWKVQVVLACCQRVSEELVRENLETIRVLADVLLRERTLKGPTATCVLRSRLDERRFRQQAMVWRGRVWACRDGKP